MSLGTAGRRMLTSGYLVSHGITDAVRAIQPYGARCQCDCGEGMATVTPADVLVVAAVSNWGAYGIEASLAILLERPELLHTTMEARRVIA